MAFGMPTTIRFAKSALGQQRTSMQFENHVRPTPKSGSQLLAVDTPALANSGQRRSAELLKGNLADLSSTTFLWIRSVLLLGRLATPAACGANRY